VGSGASARQIGVISHPSWIATLLLSEKDAHEVGEVFESIQNSNGALFARIFQGNRMEFGPVLMSGS
jgi:hypothetical protein